MLSAIDLFVTPIFLVLFIVTGIVLRKFATSDEKEQSYFLNGLVLKLFGAIFLGLIFDFYYGGADTYNYFKDCNSINAIFWDDYLAALRFIFGPAATQDEYTEKYGLMFVFFNDPPSFFVSRIGGLFSLVTFNSYMGIALCFALLSFSGSWAMYKTFCQYFPGLKNKIAFSIFYIPSVFFWGSGLLKDTITFAGLGWFFYSFSSFFVFKKFNIRYIAIMLASGYVISVVKIYILMCFAPSILIYFFLDLIQKIRSKVTRTLVTPIVFFMAIFAGLYFVDLLAQINDKYKLSNLTSQAKRSAEWLEYVSREQGGSVYTLGKLDDTFESFIEKIPAAINVSFFRPYVWESKNLIMLVSSFESTFFLLYFILIILRLGFKKILFITGSNPIMYFMIIYCLVFAYSIGISTNNFGALVRYKIPMLPFLMMYFFVLDEFYIKFFRKN